MPLMITSSITIVKHLAVTNTTFPQTKLIRKQEIRLRQPGEDYVWTFSWRS